MLILVLIVFAFVLLFTKENAIGRFPKKESDSKFQTLLDDKHLHSEFVPFGKPDFVKNKINLVKDQDTTQNKIWELFDLRNQNINADEYKKFVAAFKTETGLLKEALDWYFHHTDKSFSEYTRLKQKYKLLF